LSASSAGDHCRQRAVTASAGGGAAQEDAGEEKVDAGRGKRIKAETFHQKVKEKRKKASGAWLNMIPCNDGKFRGWLIKQLNP
jgi:hypothetical protein